MPVSKLISYVFYCFMNFLCISLFFWPFVFVFVFGEICGRHFLKHNNAKINSFQPLRVKISIFIWTMWKNSICIDFVHKITKSHFGAIFGPTCMYKKLRNFRTVPRASQIWCQNVRETWKKKVIKCRGESFARCRVIARNVEGGLLGPPPSLFRVKWPDSYCPFFKKWFWAILNWLQWQGHKNDWENKCRTNLGDFIFY